MKQPWGMYVETQERVFFIRTILLYIVHVQSSTCLHLWYKCGIFEHADKILVDILKYACNSITMLPYVHQETQF